MQSTLLAFIGRQDCKAKKSKNMTKNFLCAIMLVFVTVCGAIALSAKNAENPKKEESQMASTLYTCDRCDGSRHDPVLKCRSCSGSGFIKEVRSCDWGCNNGVVIDKYGNPQRCLRCQGAGKLVVDISCPACDGWGTAPCQKCGGSGQVVRN